MAAVAEHRAHADARQSGQRRLRPFVVIGTAYWYGHDGQGCLGQECAGDGGQQFDRRFTDQSDGRRAVIENPGGDVFGA
jgi:hypothetical protein